MLNHANPIHNHPEKGFSKPLVLPFSTSRYPASTFGQFIRKAKLEKGLGQKDLEKEIGVNEMTIVNWEHYETMPKRRRFKLRGLCDFLGLDYVDLSERFPHSDGLFG